MYTTGFRNRLNRGVQLSRTNCFDILDRIDDLERKLAAETQEKNRLVRVWMKAYYGSERDMLAITTWGINLENKLAERDAAIVAALHPTGMLTAQTNLTKFARANGIIKEGE